MSIKDGRVWCEVCRTWFDSVADYQKHFCVPVEAK